MLKFATFDRAAHERMKLVLYGKKAKIRLIGNEWCVLVGKETEEPAPKKERKPSVTDCCRERVMKGSARYFCEGCDKTVSRFGRTFG